MFKSRSAIALVVAFLITVGFATYSPASHTWGGSHWARTSSTTVPHQHRPIIVHQRHGTSVSSYNWSGYAVTGSRGSVTDVKGSWTVPASICDAANPTAQYASFWVGIDGFNSNTVEQTGTDSDCQNGHPTYYAWFEFYPQPAFLVNSLAIHAGDVISAEVQYGNRRFTVTLNNLTTGGSFSTSTRVNRAQRSSAEWIAEAPSSSGGILPLANFGTVFFNSDFAAVGGNTGDIGSYDSNYHRIDMVSISDPAVIKVLTSGLSGGTDFSGTWQNAGP